MLAVRHNLAFRSKTSVDPSPLSSPLQGNVSPILSETQKKDASVNKLYSGVPSRSPQVVLGESHKVKGATPVIRVHPPPRAKLPGRTPEVHGNIRVSSCTILLFSLPYQNGYA